MSEYVMVPRTPTVAMLLAGAHAYSVTHEDDALRGAWAVMLAAAPALSAPAPSQGADGYRDAFYEIADLLGIGARPDSPKTVWETEMRPMLQALMEPRP